MLSKTAKKRDGSCGRRDDRYLFVVEEKSLQPWGNHTEEPGGGVGGQWALCWLLLLPRLMLLASDPPLCTFRFRSHMDLERGSATDDR